MADFIAEWTKVPIQEEEPHSSLPRKEDPESWVMYFDGAFSIGGAGAGVLLVSPTGDDLKYVIQLAFSHEDATNNTAEYEGLLAGLWIAAGLGISRLVV
jgi:ribonuclease HI